MVQDQQALIHKQTNLIQEQQNQIQTQTNLIHKQQNQIKEQQNQIQTQTNLIHKQQNQIKEQQNQIQTQTNLIDKQGTLLAEYKPSTDGVSTIYNEDTLELEVIDNAFNHGTGPLRYKRGDTYYHGIGPREQRFVWYRKDVDTYFRGIIEYRSDEHPLPHIEWDTHGAQEFCNHCECDIESSRKKRVFTFYRCLGHTIH
jgi:hypothetical protein